MTAPAGSADRLWLTDVIAEAAEDGEQSGMPPDPLILSALAAVIAGRDAAAGRPV